MKNKIKHLLNKFGIYDVIRKKIIKLYYPYKYRKIEKNVKDILLRLKPVFDEQTINWWLDYGTLLGCVREGKIIKNDIDLDFGVLVEESSLQQFMENAGFRITSKTTVEGEITLEQYDIRGIGFDIFYYRKVGNKFVTNIWIPSDSSLPQNEAYKKGDGSLEETTFTYTETKETNFYDVQVRIPMDSKTYLSEHFGVDYLKPNPNFTHSDEKNKVGVEKNHKVEYF